MFAMGPSFIVPFLEQLAEFAPSLEHLSFLKQGDLGLSDKITVSSLHSRSKFLNDELIFLLLFSCVLPML